MDGVATLDRFNPWRAIVVGCGVALSPVHNMRLTQWATNDAGETLFFLPAFGYLIWIMGTGLFLLHHWDRVKESGWGEKRIVIPLLFIVGAIAISGATAEGWQDKFAPLGMGVALFGLYLMARIVGRDIFVPLAIGAGIASVGVVVSSVLHPGFVTGGLVFEGNYDIVVGYVLIGVVLVPRRWQLPLVALSLVAMFLSGSPEALFAVGVVGVVVLVRRDWSSRLVKTLVPVVVVAIVWFSLGYGQTLYGYTAKVIENEPTVPNTVENVVDPDTGEATVDVENIPEYGAMEYRVVVAKNVLSNLKPLGEGYNLTNFSKTPNLHNVPLVIVQQLGWPGILAGLAWLWVSLWCLVKTRWKYAWILVLSLSFWDHYIFTQLAPVWWAVIGISTSLIGSKNPDFIFRKG